MLASIVLGLLASSCATGVVIGPRFSLGEVLEALPLMTTADEIIARFGEPHVRQRFEDGRSTSSGLHREGSHTRPADLLDRLPAGTALLYYGFAVHGVHMTGREGVSLRIAVDDTGRILGWMWTKRFEGHENRAYADNVVYPCDRDPFCTLK